MEKYGAALGQKWQEYQAEQAQVPVAVQKQDHPARPKRKSGRHNGDEIGY
jgi:hypothetical protein